MSEYLFDCRKCTNDYIAFEADGSLARWCKPAVDGKKTLDIQGTCGKDFVIRCNYYTTEPRQAEMYPGRV